MTKGELVNFFTKKPGYLKSGNSKIARLFNVEEEIIPKAKEEARVILFSGNFKNKLITEESLLKEFIEWKKFKLLNKQIIEENLPEPFLNGDKGNVLIIGDLHEPFCLNEYLYFCRTKQEEFNCGTVVFIGDIIDNHYSSYHEAESFTDGPNAEFEKAKSKIQRWYKVFPTAFVTIGNHDRIVHRKAKTAKLADQWVLDFSTALNTPGWKFVEEIIIDDVCYNHGEGGTARARTKTELQSQVQGHLHSQFYLEYIVGNNFKVFGMQVGCGIDRSSYAFAYAKRGPKPVIGCATVTNRGKNPQLHPMEL